MRQNSGPYSILGSSPIEESDGSVDHSLQKSTYAYVNIHKPKGESTSGTE